MRMRRDRVVGEAADLVADHLQGRVAERDPPEPAGAPSPSSARQPGTRLAEPPATSRAGIAARAMARHRPRPGRDRAAGRSRPATSRCRRRAAPGIRRTRSAGSASRPRRVRRPPRAATPIADLPQRLDIGRHPGEAVHRDLLAVDQRGIEPAAFSIAAGPDPSAHAPGRPQYRFGDTQRPLGPPSGFTCSIGPFLWPYPQRFRYRPQTLLRPQ